MAIGQPTESAYIASIFIKIHLIGIYVMCHLEMVRRFLNSQGIFYLVFNAHLATLFTHAFFCYVLIFYLDMGVNGLAYTANITQILTLAIIVIYMASHQYILKEHSWHCINGDSFSNLYEYLKIGIPAMMMFCLEYF